MRDFLEFLVTLASLVAIGAIPALAASKFTTPAFGWATLCVSALLPFVVREMNLVNPVFGGWLVLAVPYRAGSVVAFFFLARKALGVKTTAQVES
ncbi:MAG: hypothetical protein ABIS39_07120 [Sphingomicrobium sp.]